MRELIKELKGEDQPRMLVFLFITVMLVAMAAIIVFVVVTASTNTSKVVLDDQKEISIYSGTVIKGVYSVASLRYSDEEEASCLTGSEFQRPVTLTLQFRPQLTPSSCSIFVNNVLLRTERKLDADCVRSCPFTEFNRQFSIGDFDYRDDHRLRICCDDICIDHTLYALCG